MHWIHPALLRSLAPMCRLLVPLWPLATYAQVDPAARATTDQPPSEHAPLQLAPVVVTATRTEEDPFSLPYAVSVVDEADFQRRLPRTTPEALRELPSVMLQKTSHGQGSPYLRGFTGFRTLMMVDGIRLNNSTFRDGPNQYWGTVDALSLERLEVVRGPSSVLYGSDAIGGTVNAFTTGRSEYQDGFDWDARTFYRYSSAERSHVGRVEVSGQYDHDVGVHFGVSPKAFGDLQGGRDVGKQPKTGYDELDWDTKLEYFVRPNSRLVYGHQTVSMDDAWRTHATIYGLKWEGTVNDTNLRRAFDQGRDLDYVQYHVESLPGFVREAHISLSYHRQDETEDRIRSNLTQELQAVDVRTLGIAAQLQSDSPVGRWVYGADYYHDWVDTSFRRFNAAGVEVAAPSQGPVADDAAYDLVGAFVEDGIPLWGDRLELRLGTRFTHAAADANKVEDLQGNRFSLSDSWNNLVGNARVLYKLDAASHGALFMGASQGFRAPNLSDLTRLEKDWAVEAPSPGVKPESFLSLEMGSRAQFERWSGEATYFHTLIHDMIARVPNGQFSGTTPIVEKLNAGEGFVHGVELSGRLSLHRDVTLWGNFTWMEGEVELPLSVGAPSQDTYISRLMPLTVNTGLRWDEPKRRFWVELAATFAADADRLSPTDLLDTQRIPPGGTPGYGVYHLRAGWSPCAKATLSAALENLTNEDYRIHGSGVNEPGRNLIIAGNFRF